MSKMTVELSREGQRLATIDVDTRAMSAGRVPNRIGRALAEGKMSALRVRDRRSMIAVERNGRFFLRPVKR